VHGLGLHVNVNTILATTTDICMMLAAVLEVFMTFKLCFNEKFQFSKHNICTNLTSPAKQLFDKQKN